MSSAGGDCTVFEASPTRTMHAFAVGILHAWNSDALASRGALCSKRRERHVFKELISEHKATAPRSHPPHGVTTAPEKQTPSQPWESRRGRVVVRDEEVWSFIC